MTEENSYDAVVRIEWTGFDTARYAIVEADTVLRVSIISSGFNAIDRDNHLKRVRYKIYATSDTTVFFSDCVKDMPVQLGLTGVREISSRQETVTLRLAPRTSRAFKPRLNGLQLSFAEPYGLAGEPQIEPDTVWLYGSEQSLEQVSCVETQPTQLMEIKGTNTYKLPLVPVWSQYTDLHPSTSYISVTIPTAVYSEKVFTLPINIEGSDEDHIKIYPEQATVTLWVADQLNNHIASDMISLAVEYDSTSRMSDKLTIRAVSFPSYVRIKRIEPVDVSYIVIKKDKNH